MRSCKPWPGTPTSPARRSTASGPSGWGTPVPGVRALSHDVVYSVLREIRDLNGAPLLRSRCHVGLEADYYALTRPDRITASAAAAARDADRARSRGLVDPGPPLRRIYELVAVGITTRGALHRGRSHPGAGDDAVTALQIAGLLTRPARGTVAVGPVTLDAIAAARNTEGQREDRIACYRAQRAQWRIWLKRNLAERAATAAQAIAAAAPAETPASSGHLDLSDDPRPARRRRQLCVPGPGAPGGSRRRPGRARRPNPRLRVAAAAASTVTNTWAILAEE